MTFRNPSGSSSPEIPPSHLYLAGEQLRPGVGSIALNVRLSSDRLSLLWDFAKSAEDFEGHNMSRRSLGALDSFIRIESPEDVLKFVTRYGPVGLCEHGLPSAHNQGSLVDEVARYAVETHFSRCHVRVIGSRSATEPVGWYLDVAATFKNVILAESAVRDWESSGFDSGKWQHVLIALERLPSQNDTVSVDWESPKKYDSKILTWLARMLPVLIVNTWFVAAGIHPAVEPEFAGKTVKRALHLNSLYFPSNAFSAVVVQLGLVMSGEAHLSRCTNCNRPYASKRSPKRGQSNWCGDAVCEREKNRINKQNSRKKKRAEHGKRQ
jgi:hypothetical protein